MLTTVCLAAAVVLSGCAGLPEANFAPAGPSLSVVTYNVNVVGAPEGVVGFLSEVRADVVCLQETHAGWEYVLRRQLSGDYPHQLFHHAPGVGGIAFLSRFPLHKPEIMLSEKAWFPAFYVRSTTPLGEVAILNLHLRPPLSEKGCVSLWAMLVTPGVHLEEIETYLGRIDPDVPTIVAGDFNEHDRGKACKRLERDGYVNALRLFDRKSPTWRWPLWLGLELKNRYDHIFVGPQLECTGARVFDLRASDHEPVLAVIRKR
jgi:endonuclease/exonuclease/phosphatase family metal-dependent hydrolase